MSKLLTTFQAMLGKNTAQQWTYWCIPTSVSNALRVLGSGDFSKERIRDHWYSHTGKQVEADPNQQLQDVSFGVMNALKGSPDFDSVFDFEVHSDAGDGDIFETAKAEKALLFVQDHLSKEHPVIASTWQLCINQNRQLFPACCHMWLILECDNNGATTYHDPHTDKIETIPTRQLTTLQVAGSSRQVDVGFRGRITHTDYNCLAIWRK